MYLGIFQIFKPNLWPYSFLFHTLFLTNNLSNFLNFYSFYYFILSLFINKHNNLVMKHLIY